MSKIVVGDPHDPDTDLGPLISFAHRDKVAGMVARAPEQGGRIVTGGVVPDLPGFGGTEPPPAAWNVTNYAAFVHEFLKKLAVQPFAIIGHSNGGAIAVRGVGQGLLQADMIILLASAGSAQLCIRMANSSPP